MSERLLQNTSETRLVSYELIQGNVYAIITEKANVLIYCSNSVTSIHIFPILNPSSFPEISMKFLVLLHKKLVELVSVRLVEICPTDLFLCVHMYEYRLKLTL